MSLFITMIRIMGMLLRGDLIRKKCVKGELFMLIVAGVNIIKEVFNCFRIFQHRKILAFYIDSINFHHRLSNNYHFAKQIKSS